MKLAEIKLMSFTKNTRPIIKLRLNKSDWALEVFSWLLVTLIATVAFGFHHGFSDFLFNKFDLSLKKDLSALNEDLFWLAVKSCLFSFPLWILSKFPHFLNYPQKITKINADSFYINGSSFLIKMNLLLLLMRCSDLFRILFIAYGISNYFMFDLFLVFCLILLFIILYQHVKKMLI